MHTYLPPKNHDTHLRSRKQTLNQPRVKSNFFLIDIADLLNHEVDVRKNAEEGNGLDNGGVAEKENLDFGEWDLLKFISFVFFRFAVVKTIWSTLTRRVCRLGDRRWRYALEKRCGLVTSCGCGASFESRTCGHFVIMGMYVDSEDVVSGVESERAVRATRLRGSGCRYGINKD